MALPGACAKRQIEPVHAAGTGQEHPQAAANKIAVKYLAAIARGSHTSDHHTALK